MLHALAGALREAEERGDSAANQVLTEEYGHVLVHLSTLYEPDAFLLLLPPNGKMSFFMPFIEASFTRHAAMAMRPSHSPGQF